MFVASRSGGSWAYASPGFERALTPDLLAALRAAAVEGGGEGGETRIMDGRGKVVDTTRGGGGASAAATAPEDDLAELEEAAAMHPAPAAPPDAAWLLGRGGE